MPGLPNLATSSCTLHYSRDSRRNMPKIGRLRCSTPSVSLPHQKSPNNGWTSFLVMTVGPRTPRYWRRAPQPVSGLFSYTPMWYEGHDCKRVPLRKSWTSFGDAYLHSSTSHGSSTIPLPRMNYSSSHGQSSHPTALLHHSR